MFIYPQPKFNIVRHTGLWNRDNKFVTHINCLLLRKETRLLDMRSKTIQSTRYYDYTRSDIKMCRVTRCAGVTGRDPVRTLMGTKRTSHPWWTGSFPLLIPLRPVGCRKIISHPDPRSDLMQFLSIFMLNRVLPRPWLHTYSISKFILVQQLFFITQKIFSFLLGFRLGSDPNPRPERAQSRIPNQE